MKCIPVDWYTMLMRRDSPSHGDVDARRSSERATIASISRRFRRASVIRGVFAPSVRVEE